MKFVKIQQKTSAPNHPTEPLTQEVVINTAQVKRVFEKGGEIVLDMGGGQHHTIRTMFTTIEHAADYLNRSDKVTVDEQQIITG